MPAISNREHDVDYNKLYALILLAKGDKRSLRQYAKDAGVSHSIFTKIKREEFKPGVHTLLHFVSEKANPQNGVTIFDFMDAAGLPRADCNRMLYEVSPFLTNKTQSFMES